MERVRARCCLAVGAIALAMSATAVGAVAAPPRDLTADLAPVAARVPMPHTSDPTQDEEGHDDPTPHPSEDPGVDGDPHGMDPVPSDDPHGGMEDPTHDEEMASAEPMDMGGHGAESSPSAAPGHGHGAEPSPEMSPPCRLRRPRRRCRTWTTRRWRATSRRTTVTTRRTTPRSATTTPPAATTTRTPAEERPRAVVLGGFVAINGLVLGAAALTRRRDRAGRRAEGAPDAHHLQPEKDASR